MNEASQQSVLVILDGAGLPDEVYEKYDLEQLEEQLMAALKQADAGEYDGNEFGPTEVTLFMHGADAEALYRAVDPVLRAYPLCQGARIIIRPGGPETPGREVELPRLS
jgi:hypothetical protein